MSGSFPAARSSRLHTPFANVRELRIGRYLVDRALFHANSVSRSFEMLVRRKCAQLGFEPDAAEVSQRDQIILEVATRIAPYVRAALRKEFRNRETILFKPDDTQNF